MMELLIDLDPTLRSSFHGARTLVTGGAGFIARHLTAGLLAVGADVVLVDERPLPSSGYPGAAWPESHQLSVGTEPFRRFLQQAGPFDYIFHLAAQAYAADSVGAPMLDFNANLVATLDLIEQLRLLNAPSRFVFASSAAVYGNPTRVPIEESDITIPISPYGVSKLAAERYVAVYARLHGLSAASLRLFSVYGPHQMKQVVYDLLRKLRASPDRLVVLGDGTQMRDLVYVGDVARAFLTVAARGRADGYAYNVASGVGTSTAELARLIVEVQQSTADIVFTGAIRPGDPERWIGAAAPLAQLGAAPCVSLHDGLRATAQWFNTDAAEQAVSGAELPGRRIHAAS
jgi:UDP-glucose 4-epimerase